MIPSTGKERRTLKSMAKVRSIDIKIGKKGLTENAIKEIKDITIIVIISLTVSKIFFITLIIINNTFYTFFHYHKNKGHYDLFVFL